MKTARFPRWKNNLTERLPRGRGPSSHRCGFTFSESDYHAAFKILANRIEGQDRQLKERLQAQLQEIDLYYCNDNLRYYRLLPKPPWNAKSLGACVNVRYNFLPIYWNITGIGHGSWCMLLGHYSAIAEMCHSVRKKKLSKWCYFNRHLIKKKN